VEHDRRAVAVIHDNLNRAGVADQASVHQADVLRYIAGSAGDRFGLVFLDPPYAERAILAPLERLVARLAPGATVVIKHHWRTPIPEPPGLIRWRERRFGETALTFLAATDRADGVEEP
jgi:16S rRNA (guanine966-N2)-methyltransferase